MATPIKDLSVEVAQGDLETSDVELGEVYFWPAGHTATSSDGAVFIEIGPVGPMRKFHEHALKVFS